MAQEAEESSKITVELTSLQTLKFMNINMNINTTIRSLNIIINKLHQIGHQYEHRISS